MGDDPWQERRQPTVGPAARERHGEPAWDDAQRAGAALGFDDAIALEIGR
jgi:hypothetical protein